MGIVERTLIVFVVLKLKAELFILRFESFWMLGTDDEKIELRYELEKSVLGMSSL